MKFAKIFRKINKVFFANYKMQNNYFTKAFRTFVYYTEESRGAKLQTTSYSLRRFSYLYSIDFFKCKDQDEDFKSMLIQKICLPRMHLHKMNLRTNILYIFQLCGNNLRVTIIYE